MSLTNNPFLLSLPGDWLDQTVHTFLGPTINGIRHSIVVTVDPFIVRKCSTEEYSLQRLINLQSSLPSFELLKNGEHLLPSGRSCHQMVYRYCAEGKTFLYQKQICIISKKKAYLFTSTYTEQTLETYGAAIDQIIDTLKTEAEWTDEE